MSKYNNMKSIPVSSIPKWRLKKAIHEWAEGSNALESLLTTCYKKNVKTSGSHAGVGPYIGFDYTKEADILANAFTVIEEIEDFQILLEPDGGNPLSGKDWYVPIITLGSFADSPEEVEKLFTKIEDKITEEKKENNPLLDIFTFFIDKESGLSFRLRRYDNHNKNNDKKYVFKIASKIVPKDREDYYKRILSNAGLTEIPFNIEVCPYQEWKIESDDYNDIMSSIKDAADYIIMNYALEPPTSENEILDNQLLTRFKRKELNQKQIEKYFKSLSHR